MIRDRPWMHFREPENPHSLSDVYMDYPRVERNVRNLSLFFALVLLPFFTRLGTTAVHIFNAYDIVQERSIVSSCDEDESCGHLAPLVSKGAFRWIYLAFAILVILVSLVNKVVALSTFRSDRVDGIVSNPAAFQIASLFSLDRFILLSELRGPVFSRPFFARELSRQVRWKAFWVVASFPVQLLNWILVETWAERGAQPKDHWTFLCSLSFYFFFDLVPFLLAVIAYSPVRSAFTQTKLRRYLGYLLEQNVAAIQSLHGSRTSPMESVDKGSVGKGRT